MLISENLSYKFMTKTIRIITFLALNRIKLTLVDLF